MWYKFKKHACKSWIQDFYTSKLTNEIKLQLNSTFFLTYISLSGVSHIPPSSWRSVDLICRSNNPSKWAVDLIFLFLPKGDWYGSQESLKGDTLMGNILPTKIPKGTWLHAPVFAVLIPRQKKLHFLKKSVLNHSEIVNLYQGIQLSPGHNR